MISIFRLFGVFFVLLAVTGVQARAADETTVAAIISSQTESAQACLTRAVRQVADEMDQAKPGSGRKVRDLFTRVLTHHSQPLGEEDFYRELRFLERLGGAGKADLDKITVAWIVRDVVREELSITAME